jgi:hypothetical protein
MPSKAASSFNDLWRIQVPERRSTFDYEPEREKKLLLDMVLGSTKVIARKGVPALNGNRSASLRRQVDFAARDFVLQRSGKMVNVGRRDVH